MKERIRKATRKDLEGYSKLRKKWDKEYSVIANQKLKLTNEQIRKEFNKIIKNKKRYLLVIDENGEILGYLTASLFSNNYGRFVYIDDIFIGKNYRKRGLAAKLIKNFSDIIRKKQIKKIRLGVNIKNRNALRLYKKIGFKLIHYEMDLKIK